MTNDVKLGELIPGEAQRDAVHVAIAPMIAVGVLSPGERVGLVSGVNSRLAGACKDPIGIVDPFLMRPVVDGQRFWLVLFPNTVTGMRHEWQHPSFDGSCVESEKWLRKYAAKMSPYDEGDSAYDKMIEHIRQGEVFAHGTDLHGLDELDEADEFFEHLAIVLGRPVDRHSLEYSCSC